MHDAPIGVEKATLGGALRGGPLWIPPYQREYSWRADRVRKLFDDFNSAKLKRREHYFLGTVVLTPGYPPNVIDGQQRLATTCVVLAAIRDALLNLGFQDEADSIDRDFLFKYDRNQKENVPRLRMNIEDREYMLDRVLLPPSKRKGRPAVVHSNRRINDAALVAADRVAGIMASAASSAAQAEILNSWVEFIDRNALVVMLTPPNAAGAFQMFKTLNDRAQRTTQADMIKNHLFEHADDGVEEAQSKWSSMKSTIEGLGFSGDDDPLLSYLHQVSIVLNGPVKADDIFELMESTLSGRANALAFVDALATFATDYAAIATPTHAKWGKAGYQESVRQHVEDVSQSIKMSFIRPLMLAVAARFTPRETNKTFRAFASWVVRFLIAGGSRSGRVIDAIGKAANDVHAGKVKTAEKLCAQLASILPSDVRFRESFATKTITSSRQARFILRELEAQKRTGKAESQLAPVADQSKLTLEHILPKNLEAKTGWTHFTNDERKVYRYRLGNFVLLDTRDNGAAGDKPFADKRPLIEKSKHIWLTAEVIDLTAADHTSWTKELIATRQKLMADLAVKRWPLQP